MAEPIDPQSMSNEEGQQRLTEITRRMEELGTPAKPC